MDSAKGSLRDRLLTNKIIKFNIKKRKELDLLEIKKKKEEELLRIRKLLDIKKVSNTITINPDKTKNISEESNILNLEKELKKSLLIDEDTIIKIDYNQESKTVINKSQNRNLTTFIEEEITKVKIEKQVIEKVQAHTDSSVEELKYLKVDIENSKPEKKDVRVSDIVIKEKKLKTVEQKNEKKEKEIFSTLENKEFLPYGIYGEEDIITKISEYKAISPTEKDLSDLALECSKIIKEADTSANIKEDIVETEVDLKRQKKKLRERDNDYDLFDKKVKLTDELNNKIASNIYESQQKINDMEKTLKYLIGKERRVAEISYFDFCCYNLLKLSVFMTRAKNGKISTMLASIYMNKMFNKEKIKKKNIKIIEEERTKIGHKLDDNLYKIESVMESLAESLSNVKNLKRYFVSNFEIYKDSIPEYDSIFKRLSLAEQFISTKEKELVEARMQINNSKEKNKDKIKILKKDIAA